MPVTYSTDRLLTLIRRARQAIIIRVNTEISAELLDTCISQAEAGLAIELLIRNENKALLEDNPFLLHKCLLLVKKGAIFFLLPHGANDKIYECIIDFNEVCDLYSDGITSISEANNLDELQNRIRDCGTLKRESDPYLMERGDIGINLIVSDNNVLKGDTIQLNWEVVLADRIVIQGIGNVDAYGSKNVLMQKSAIIKIGAYNARQSRIRAIKVWVSEEVRISYDIGFLSKQTEAYYSLVQADNYPHIYGVTRGNAIRFSWQVTDANEVRITPFNFSNHKGEHVFTPTESMKIEIQSQIQGRIFSRRITLLIFPIPVFKDKLITPIRNVDHPYPFIIPMEMQTRFAGHLQAMLKNEEKRYAMLNASLYREYAAIQSKKINLKKVNAFLFAFLRKTHSKKAGIISVIQSIQDYYNNPKRGY